MTKNITIALLNEIQFTNYGTRANTYEIFPIGTGVKIVTYISDFTYFHGETGVVVENTGIYLGISVKLDVPRKYADGQIDYVFNFQPHHLIVIKNVKEVLNFQI